MLTVIRTVLNQARPLFPIGCVILLSACAGAVTGYAAGRQRAENHAMVDEALSPVRLRGVPYAFTGQPAVGKGLPSEAPEEARYVVGMANGFVAVFYAVPKGGETLKELTATPTIALPLEEQRRLLEGIMVYTDEQLVKILQDYGS